MKNDFPEDQVEEESDGTRFLNKNAVILRVDGNRPGQVVETWFNSKDRPREDQWGTRDVGLDYVRARLEKGEKVVLRDETWKNHHCSLSELRLEKGFLVVYFQGGDYDAFPVFESEQYYQVSDLEALIKGEELEPIREVNRSLEWVEEEEDA
jgi:hypothetical protein